MAAAHPCQAQYGPCGVEVPKREAQRGVGLVFRLHGAPSGGEGTRVARANEK